MQIRGITKRDYDQVVSVLDRWWGGPSRENAHPIFFYEFGEHALIAEEEGELVGFLIGFITRPLVDPTDSLGYVHLVGIHPDFRRRGVGKALYEQFEERCVAAGATSIKAITTVGNAGSVRFHEALEFKVRREDDYAGYGRARIVFEKTLSDPIH